MPTDRRATTASLIEVSLVVVNLVAVLVLLVGVNTAQKAAEGIHESPRECTAVALGEGHYAWVPVTPAEYTDPDTLEFDVRHTRHDDRTRRIECHVRIITGDDLVGVVVDDAEVVADDAEVVADRVEVGDGADGPQGDQP